MNRHNQPHPYLTIDEIAAKTSRTISYDVDQQIKQKYKTFTRFNYRHLMSQKKQKCKVRQVESFKSGNPLTNLFANTIEQCNKKSTQQPKKKKLIAQQLIMKSQRRQRLKKTINPFNIIKHYMQRQSFKPTEEEMYLLTSLAQLRSFSQQNNLQTILKKIYKLMNEAVDLNQLRLLCLLIFLTADICFQFKDFKRSFYFYNQARKFTSYSGLYALKAQSLISLGHITQQMKQYSQSLLFFKKALQYAWKSKNKQQQMLIYDKMGSCYYYQGNIKQAHYFHTRSTKNQYQSNESAIKSISLQMIDSYEKYILPLQKKNLTSLFLEYLSLPIAGLESFPMAQVQQKNRKVYNNYQELFTPRQKVKAYRYQLIDFPDLNWQLCKLINEDQQFKSQIPSPDIQRNFTVVQKYGKTRKNKSFQQSFQFHKFLPTKRKKININKLHFFSLQQRIERAVNAHTTVDWFSQMKNKIRHSQAQNVGHMRDHIINSHQSYAKYPQQRRKAYSLKNQKVKQSINKLLIEWIDPVVK